MTKYREGDTVYFRTPNKNKAMALPCIGRIAGVCTSCDGKETLYHVVVKNRTMASFNMREDQLFDNKADLMNSVLQHMLDAENEHNAEMKLYAELIMMIEELK